MSSNEAARLRIAVAIQMIDSAIFEVEHVSKQLSQVTHTIAIHDQLPMTLTSLRIIKSSLEELKLKNPEMDSSWVRKNR